MVNEFWMYDGVTITTKQDSVVGAMATEELAEHVVRLHNAERYDKTFREFAKKIKAPVPEHLILDLGNMTTAEATQWLAEFKALSAKANPQDIKILYENERLIDPEAAF